MITPNTDRPVWLPKPTLKPIKHTASHTHGPLVTQCKLS